MAQLPRLHVDRRGVIKAIKDGPGNYLGTDSRGRAHWRKNAQGGGKSGGGKALVGHEAIEHAEKHGLKLSKYADPTEGARHGLSPDEAREVAAEDPSLIYLKQDDGRSGGGEGGDSGSGRSGRPKHEKIRALADDAGALLDPSYRAHGDLYVIAESMLARNPRTTARQVAAAAREARAEWEKERDYQERN